jgi:hypothetical protein
MKDDLRRVKILSLKETDSSDNPPDEKKDLLSPIKFFRSFHPDRSEMV